jgi:hypothetical protein
MQSEQLESVLKNLYGGEEDLLLGELQFAFIAFLVYFRLHVALLLTSHYASYNGVGVLTLLD